MSQILLTSRHYPPDVGAPAFRLHHLAQVLAEEHHVVVLAAQPNRYGDGQVAPAFERQGPLTVHRVWNGQVVKARGKFGRGATELLGGLWMMAVALVRYRHVDAVFVTSPPLFYMLPGWALNRFCRRTLVVDVRDLWLDWVQETNLVSSARALEVLGWFHDATLTAASHITTATRSFRDMLVRRYGLVPERVTVVYNGLDEVVQPSLVPNGAPCAATHRAGTVRLLYAGNLGPSQNLLGILEGLHQSLARHPELEVWIVGDGLQHGALKRAETDRLRVVGRVDRASLQALYEESDAFLLHLADLAVYHHTVPSKLFEYLAYGKPLLCGVRGEAREISARYTDCYYFASDDAASAAAAIDRLIRREPPDNSGAPRAGRQELFRAARGPIWKQVFADGLRDV